MPTTTRSRGLRCAASLAIAATALTGCSGDAAGGKPDRPAADQGGRATATVPAGWESRQVAGLRVAWPPDFQVRTDATGAALQVGIPFTGQPFPPPQVQVYVETEPVGTLQVREPLTRAQISQQLGGVEIPPSTPVTVAGARAAVEFTYDYTTEGGTSVLDTPLEPTPMRQSDLLIDVPGLPKYGLRYSAPADQYDERLWRQLVAALEVTSDQPPS